MSEISLTALTPLMPSQSAESESPKAAQESSKTQQESAAPIEPKQKPAAPTAQANRSQGQSQDGGLLIDGQF